ncbi:GNAT family N-acetyltransferase [Propioniciclava sp.]|uniref:GNAT family N-acetyltransferase n=1 Tax=Propioniciclava sp. TaxID=2038686 RepID=UPI00263356C3|nr:GNAT family N-acetyltransferase [Propioniciclava sp.]
MAIEVIDNPERERFEVREGRRVIGWAAYQETARLIVFTHTEVDPAYEGQGIGSQLVRATLDHVRAQGMQVLPTCPFVSAWMGRHPEYDDLRYRPGDEA